MYSLILSRLACLAVCLTFHATTMAQGFEGYYQFPDVHDKQIIFCAEGDIWTVSLDGGLAQRLTTHAEEERFPLFSPDGTHILFSASYEGPTELYTMPVQGGPTQRWTYERESSIATAWPSPNSIVYTTTAYNKKPDERLVKINIKSQEKNFIPLDQASEAAFDASGKTVFFVRPAYHGNVTKRYQGGTARQIWKFTEGNAEAIKLTKDHAGESHHPMWFQNRIYFIRSPVLKFHLCASSGCIQMGFRFEISVSHFALADRE